MKNHNVMDDSIPCRKSFNFISLVSLIILTIFLGACVGDYIQPTPQQGYYYMVKKGDTLYRIAADRKVNLQELAELNGIENAASITEGMVLFIPGIAPEEGQSKVEDNRDGEAKKVIPAGAGPKKADTGKNKIESTTVAKSGQSVTASGYPKTEKKQSNQEKNREAERGSQSKAKVAVKKDSKQSEGGSTEAPAERKEEGQPKGKFMWPARGKVISNYGPQPNGMFYNGIRIEIRKETTVNAASAGHVIFSAFLKDYGETVIIKHDNDFATVYTHLTRRLVKVDQLVKRGESIALLVPSAGGASFFEFEIRYRNKAKDPLLFL